ncbi:unnamed protein product [Kluyveromyces dobzhanskii CBS 2104]|uniref:WGS project CCBQ000000000 data, contig MAT n=1 Tax=Kluyveromyces dobzhanskii CBS 2104 TaxID=1427455 RepID=A0A0A8L1E7_9SACH|nr:unnamed protein product [Kluyveromyces dobzhanskii CBS 2104]
MNILDDLNENILKGKRKTYTKSINEDDEKLDSTAAALLADNVVNRVIRRLDGGLHENSEDTVSDTIKIPFLPNDSSLYDGNSLDDDFEAMQDSAPVRTQRIIEVQERKPALSQTQLISSFPLSDRPKTQKCAQQTYPDLDTQLDEEEATQFGNTEVFLNETAMEKGKIHNERGVFRKPTFNFKLTTTKNQGLSVTKPFETHVECADEPVATQLDDRNEVGLSVKNTALSLSSLSCPSLKIVQKKHIAEKFIDEFDDSESTSSEEPSKSTNEDHVEALSVQKYGDEQKKTTSGRLKERSVRTIKNNQQKYIELNSSSESDDDYKSRNSKAALLIIKAKRTRKKETSAKTVHDSNTDSLKELFTSLKMKNRNQILEHRKEISDRKGISLEAIEHEKIQVEKLLEQELERNRRVKLREKRERQKNGVQLKTRSSVENSSSDVPDSDGAESDDWQDSMPGRAASSDYDDMGISLQHKNNNPVIEDDDSSSSSDDAESNKQALGINLGHYGDNLGSNTVEANLSGHLTDAGESGKPNITVSKSLSERLGVGEISSSSSDAADSSEDDLSEGERKNLEQQAKLHRRLEAEEAKKKKKTLKSSGLSKMFEMEAEESEDEWHGVGGADGENSDEYDSEVDNMLDDFSKSNFDIAAVREKLALENKEMDERMINRILHDINTGGFRKRGRGSLDLELSDDEDELLRQFREKRRELMKQKMLENSDGVPSHTKSKAFFESMIEDIGIRSIPASASDNALEKTGKKKIIISEEFVQSSLSFLSAKDGSINEFEAPEIKHDEVEDLDSLKQRSVIKMLNSPKGKTNENFSDELNQTSLDFKLPSVVKSFSSSSDVNDKFRTGIKTVTISKSYRVASGSRSAITFLGKKRKLKAPKSSETAPLPRKPTSSLFDSNSNSFS